jgi:anti-sigma factor RsiW
MDPWVDRLSEYIDGELRPDERAAVERHLQVCADCRETAADLRAVVRRASSVSDRAPAADLWLDIEPRIARIGQPRKFTLTFSVGHIAAAAVVLLAVSVGLFWLMRPASQPVTDTAPAARESRAPATALPVRFADETYEKALVDLERALEEGRDRLDPRTIAIVEQNLKTIDGAIAQARQALEADPANTYLNTHLAQARRRKLALLQRVSAMANPEG